MARVVGIDPGTVSLDLCGLDGDELFLDRSVPAAEVAADPGSVVRLLLDANPLDLIAGPSGYGLPLVRIERLTARDLFLAFLPRADDDAPGILGLERLVEALRAAALPVVFTPGVIHLPTVPAHRKANRARGGPVGPARRSGLDRVGAARAARAVRAAGAAPGLRVGGQDRGPGGRARRRRPGRRSADRARFRDGVRAGLGHGSRLSWLRRRRRVTKGDRPTSGTILIAAYSARALAESAVRAGYRCTTVDVFGDLDLVRIAPNTALGADLGKAYSPEALVRAAERIPADSVVYGAGLENRPRLVERLARGRELLGNGPEALARVRDIVCVGGLLSAAGVAVPLTLPPDRADEAVADRRWLRKPARGGGGAGIRFWRRGTRIGAGELLQEHVEGLPGSAAFVADGREIRLLAVCRQLVGDPTFGAGRFRYAGSVWPLHADDEQLLGSVVQQAARAAAALVRAFALRGVFGLDFVLREGAIHVLEVNPRVTASMELVERATGASIFDLHVRACRGALPAADLRLAPVGGAVGKAILFARRRARLGDTRPWLRLGARDVPRPGSTIAARAPVCTIFAQARDPESCVAALRRGAASWWPRIEAPREKRRAS